jgi:hypothetical protein
MYAAGRAHQMTAGLHRASQAPPVLQGPRQPTGRRVRSVFHSFQARAPSLGQVDVLLGLARTALKCLAAGQPHWSTSPRVSFRRKAGLLCRRGHLATCNSGDSPFSIVLDGRWMNGANPRLPAGICTSRRLTRLNAACSVESGPTAVLTACNTFSMMPLAQLGVFSYDIGNIVRSVE